MRVLVGVNMGYDDARGLNLSNLRHGFGFDLFLIKVARERPGGEDLQAFSKPWNVRTSLDQGRHLRRPKHGVSVDQHNVAANAQPGYRLRQLCSFRKSRAAGHHSGRCHNAPSVRLHDGAVYTRGEAQIIRVDDQPSHCVSLAGTVSGRLLVLAVETYGRFSSNTKFRSVSYRCRFDPIFATRVYSIGRGSRG
jgi:hypothetical protein